MEELSKINWRSSIDDDEINDDIASGQAMDMTQPPMHQISLPLGLSADFRWALEQHQVKTIFQMVKSLLPPDVRRFRLRNIPGEPLILLWLPPGKEWDYPIRIHVEHQFEILGP